MFEVIKRIIAPPQFIDDAKSANARFINNVLIICFVVFVFALFFRILFIHDDAPITLLLWGLPCLIVLKILLHYHLTLTTYLTVLIVWVMITYRLILDGGVYRPLTIAYVLVIFLAGVFISKRSAIVAIVVSIVTELGIVYFMREGHISIPDMPVAQPEMVVFTHSIVFVIVGIIVYIGNDMVVKALFNTQRHREKLIVSEKRLRAIAGSLPDRAVILDADGYYSDVLKPNYDSASIGTRFGGTTGTHLKDSFPNAFVDFCIQKVREAIDANETLMFEYDFPDPVEDLIYTLEGRAVPFIDPISSKPMVIWLSRNITDRKSTEKALIESEKLLRTVVRALPDRTLIFDYDGRYQEILKPEHSLATGPAGIHDVEIGRPIHDFFPKEFADFCLEKIRKTSDSGEMQNFEYPAPNPAENRFYEARTIPFRDPKTGTKQVLWIVRDVTERKDTEKALVESEKLLRTAIGAYPDRTLMFDRDGHYKEFLKIGLPLSDHDAPNIEIQVGDLLHHHLPKEFADFCLQKIQETLALGEMLVFEYPAPFGDVSLFFEARTLPFRDPITAEEQVLWITRDVTEGKQAEQHRLDLALQQQKLEFFRQFVDNMIHDLKTPLAAIITNLYILERLQDEVGRQQRADNIKREVAMIEQMIDDMLMVSRLDSIPELEFETIDLVPLLQDALSYLRPKAEQKFQQLNTQLTSESAMIKASNKELRRALTNLIENAIKYTPDQGEVTVQLYSDKNEIIAEVQDTGIGIHVDEIPRIFERFYRTKTGRVTAKGTGLGLTIVHRIIELHGGKIEVESVASEGSTFRVRLPVA